MTQPIIRVESLGKQYKLRHQATIRYQTLREALAARVRKGFTSQAANSEDSQMVEDFWALKDVNVDIQRGDVVGIIGRNGAGKSTFLKLLSRITEPTTGRIIVRGRVASLLEVGTGFHPELSGRENIFLNGAILGMTKAEIRARFDEIVSFAEVATFLDTPVKHFSSGMYMRLAFSVAAHLEPEILLVDEVLAVGDAEFQRKCMGKMRDVAERGRTVLFVSHTMHAIQSLCRSGLLLAKGGVAFYGTADEAIQRYASSGSMMTGRWQRPPEAVRRALEIQEVTIALAGEQPRHILNVALSLRSNAAHGDAFVAIDIFDASGVKIMQAMPHAEPFLAASSEGFTTTIEVDLPPLIPGTYSVGVWLGSHFTQTFDEVKECGTFEVAAGPTAGRSFPYYRAHGSIVPVSRIITA